MYINMNLKWACSGVDKPSNNRDPKTQLHPVAPQASAVHGRAASFQA